jgi:hypothetical protein
MVFSPYVFENFSLWRDIMSEEYEPAERRIAKLEADVAKQGAQIRTLVVLLSAKASSPFGSPWQRFLDGPDSDKFFDTTAEFLCVVECSRVFTQMWDAAGTDEAAQDAAINALSDCGLKCAGLR